ncbi:MAG: hypothetical protein ABH871_00850 [Pseudomonadota bacterium]
MSYSASALPIFPHALIPIGTTQPSPLFILPSRSSCPVDPFKKDEQAAVDQFTPYKSTGILVPLTPLQTQKDIRSHLKAARQARANNDRQSAAERYRNAADILEKPLSQASTSPLYNEIPHGQDFYKEALFGAAGFSGPDLAAENITRLSGFIDNPPPETTQLDLAKAKLLKTFTLLQHASSAQEPQATLFERAYRLVDETIETFPSDDKANDDVIFYGNLLSIEILTRLLAHAHNRGDHKVEFKYADDIKQCFKRIMGPDTPQDRFEIIAEYEADVITLMARICLWGPALEIGRRLTEPDSPFKNTPAAKRLLSEKIFQPFIEDYGTGKAFLQIGEIRLRAREHAVRRHVLTAIAYAYSENLKQTAAYGGIGLLTGIVADLALLQGSYNMFAGAMGATIAIAYNRLRNGWTTPEAVYADEIGTSDPTWKQSAVDIAKFTIKSGIDAAAWAIPAAVIDTGIDGINITADTLSRAGDLYYRFGKWAITSAPALVQPETYTGLIDSVSNMDSTRVAYHAYTGVAGLLYATNLFSSKSRRFTDRWAWLLLPGAIMLSADLGMLISNQPPWLDRVLHQITSGDINSLMHEKWFDRMQRSSIVAGEMLFFMLTAGLLALEDRRSPRKVFASIAKVINPFSKNSSYALPLTAALLANVGSAMGGMMQKGTDPSTLPFTLMAIQGAATTFGLLGIVMGVSGILKGTIPIGHGIREGWQDSIGESIHRRIASISIGALTAFNYPYAHNRVFRSWTWDLPAAALRTMLGWDTNPGQIAMSATNFAAGNGTSTATWPETGGTMWERDQVLKWTNEAKDAIAAI